MNKYIKSNALNWSIDDIHAHAAENALPISDETAKAMLQDFFDIHEDYLIETINDLMYNYVSDKSIYLQNNNDL